MLARWVAACARRAPLVVLAALVATAAAAWFAGARFRIDTDRDAMLSSELAFKRQEERVEALFPQFADGLVIVVDARTPEEARGVALALAAELETDDERFEEVLVPRAEPFLERHGLLFLPLEELDELALRLAQVQPFLGRLTRDPSAAGLFEMLGAAYEARAEGREVELGRVAAAVDAAARAALAGEARPMSWQELMGAAPPGSDARRQYVLAQPRLDYGRVFAGEPAIERVRELTAANGWEAGGVRVRITGGLALSHEELTSVLAGSERIALLVALMVGAVLFAALRSWRLVGAVLLTLFVGLTLTAAFALATVGRFNLISIAFAALYLGLGVDYAIHLALRARELAGEGLAPVDALRGAAGDVGGSLALCALSTALGFLSFAPTAYRGVSELGIISAGGMAISLGVTVTLLPALLALGGLARAARDGARPGRRPAWVERAIDLPVNHRRAVLAGAGLTALAALTLAPRVRFDANPLNLREPESESVATFRDLLATSATPPWSATVLARDLDVLEALAPRLGALPEVGAVLSVESFVPVEQDEKLAVLEELGFVLAGTLEPADEPPARAPAVQASAAAALADAIEAAPADDEPARALAATARELAGALRREGAPLVELLERNLLATLPESLARLSRALAAGPVTLASLPPELRRRWQAPTAECRLEVFPRAGLDLEAPADLARFVADLRAVAPEASGPPVEMLESGRAVVGAFRVALTTAVVAVGLLVLLVLRRLVDVALVLGPLLLAALWTGATMALCDMRFHFANVIALPLMLGIGVDSGVHMVHRWRAGGVAANPLRSSTARGVFYAALTTLASFANIAFAAHPGTAGLGATLAIALAWTLVAALVVLPALLARRG